jgi:hypothetical protein
MMELSLELSRQDKCRRAKGLKSLARFCAAKFNEHLSGKDRIFMPVLLLF